MKIADKLLSLGALSVAVTRNDQRQINKLIVIAPDGVEIQITRYSDNCPDYAWAEKAWFKMDRKTFLEAYDSGVRLENCITEN